jgi:hypothetical protein
VRLVILSRKQRSGVSLLGKPTSCACSARYSMEVNSENKQNDATCGRSVCW